MASARKQDDPRLSAPPALILFARLDMAVERGDHEAAAEAQRQLARLGITVRYGRPRRQRKAVADAAR